MRAIKQRKRCGGKNTTYILADDTRIIEVVNESGHESQLFRSKGGHDVIGRFKRFDASVELYL